MYRYIHTLDSRCHTPSSLTKGIESRMGEQEARGGLAALTRIPWTQVLKAVQVRHTPLPYWSKHLKRPLLVPSKTNVQRPPAANNAGVSFCICPDHHVNHSNEELIHLHVPLDRFSKNVLTSSSASRTWYCYHHEHMKLAWKFGPCILSSKPQVILQAMNLVYPWLFLRIFMSIQVSNQHLCALSICYYAAIFASQSTDIFWPHHTCNFFFLLHWIYDFFILDLFIVFSPFLLHAIYFFFILYLVITFLCQCSYSARLFYRNTCLHSSTLWNAADKSNRARRMPFCDIGL